MSYVICVENDAKVDAMCHTLKTDIRYLKCTKIDAKEKEKKEKKEKEKKEKEKKEQKKILKEIPKKRKQKSEFKLIKF